MPLTACLILHGKDAPVFLAGAFVLPGRVSCDILGLWKAYGRKSWYRRMGVKVRIYLFRHGETDWNKERRLQGQSDIPLNGEGRELAVRTAEALRAEGLFFDRAFCSPLHRARETAEILIGGGSTPLTVDGRLKEMCFGEFEGGYFDEVKQKDSSHPLHNFFCRPKAYIPPAGAESFQEAAARGKEFLEEEILPLEGICGKVLIVAHGAFNRCILNAILGIPEEDFWKIVLPNCAASILSLEDGKLGVVESSKVFYGEALNGSP